MGAGVAGLRAAVELAQHGDVLVVTKESLSESNTHYAQGGIAVATEGEADVSLHLEDTVNAGDGLVYRPAAEVLVSQGPLRVAELIEWGAAFDKEAGRLLRTREGAHSLPRILHANGDATGAEISRSLVAFAHAHKRIQFAEWTMVTSLVVVDGRVAGADLASAGPLAVDPVPHRIGARSVLIASGGAGQVYSDTTNPGVATGDGIALALEAGAALADMEFYQFHPTALALPGVPRFLLSEALRGEGAYLRNHARERFMPGYHELAELAPRDVVARAIHREIQTSKAAVPMVYLDVTHLDAEKLKLRFPRIYQTCKQYGLDITRDLIPIRPAAHYAMGGVRTDLDGRASLPGLYAAGEAACTGVHGGNRLASNSLLEGLVFGARAAQGMAAENAPAQLDAARTPAVKSTFCGEGDEEALRRETQQLMEDNVGIIRDADRLSEAVRRLREILAALPAPSNRKRAEARNIAESGLAIACSALARCESRGGHYRSDYPAKDDANFRKHSVMQGGTVRFE